MDAVPRRAWLVWTVGLVAYVAAVLQRTSFGVAGLDAVARYRVSASVLAGFTVLQLVVYAALQVPVGVVLDRVGSRRMVAAGAFLMALGQTALALSGTVLGAYAGRALVGAGDALTFISVLRLVPQWFPPRRTPVLTQVTSLTGQVGQILSAVPLVALLHLHGWTTAFLSAAAIALLAGCLVLALVRDAPDTPPATPSSGPSPGAPRRSIGAGQAERPGQAASLRRVLADLRSAWRHPGTRLGLWTHFTTQFSGTVFALMWGYPFLISGQGLSRGQASAFLALFVVVGVVTGPVLGVLVQRHPLRRSWLVLGIIGVTAAVWTVVLLWPGPAPWWLLTVLVMVLAAGAPGSMIGFDFARTFNPANRLGTATGIVNVGGFVASLVTILLVGIVLDARTGGGTSYTLPDLQVALAVQYPFWAVGLVGILLTRRRVRRRMAARGVVVPPIREALARRRRRRSA